MQRSPGAARPVSARAGLAARADRILRLAGDVRFAAIILVIAGAWNAAAAVAPSGPASLDSPLYLLLLGVILLSGLAGVGVRLPAAWREWRRPIAVPEGRGALVDVVASVGADVSATAAALGRLGYRTRVAGAGERWAVHGARRGWARFAGLLSHVALVIIVVGAGMGTAYASETTFTLLPGEQALLDDPRPGFTDAVRFDALDAAFDADGRPWRLDTAVTFLRDGQPVRAATLQVNAPGSFGGYLVHGWTYGPAALLRVSTLADRVLHDGPLALDGVRDGRPAALLSLPSTGQTIAVVLADAAANTLALSVTGTGAPADATILAPGESARLGDHRVRLDGFSSWVTFLSRRDPGMGMLFTGAALLSACLAVVFWTPRRRVTVRPAPGGLRLTLRGERFDLPAAELARLRRALGEP